MKQDLRRLAPAVQEVPVTRSDRTYHISLGNKCVCITVTSKSSCYPDGAMDGVKLLYGFDV
jgi:hypothetical protein